MEPPQWAVDLRDHIWTEYSSRMDDAPTLIWRARPKYHGSSGHYDIVAHRCTVSAGTDRLGQELALIHEMSHALSPPISTILVPRRAHDVFFYLKFWIIIRDLGVSPKEAIEQELWYRTLSIVVAEVVGIPGAKEAHAAYRAQMAENKRKRKAEKHLTD